MNSTYHEIEARLANGGRVGTQWKSTGEKAPATAPRPSPPPPPALAYISHWPLRHYWHLRFALFFRHAAQVSSRIINKCDMCRVSSRVTRHTLRARYLRRFGMFATLQTLFCLHMRDARRRHTCHFLHTVLCVPDLSRKSLANGLALARRQAARTAARRHPS